jgi:hypothetical protein
MKLTSPIRDLVIIMLVAGSMGAGWGLLKANLKAEALEMEIEHNKLRISELLKLRGEECPEGKK